MVDRVSLTPAEREPLQAVLRGLKAKVDQWTVGRLALARSLQEPDPPSPARYPPAPQQSGGVLLHPQQLTGEGKSPEEDFTEIYRALLSEHEGENLFEDEDAFSDALQRHVRRGLELLRTEWTEGRTYLSICSISCTMIGRRRTMTSSTARNSRSGCSAFLASLALAPISSRSRTALG